MQNKLFELKNVKKEFNQDMVALNDINLTINKGVTVIIGPSGSGKSTLLRTLNLLEKPTSGNIYYNDNDITSNDYNLQTHRKEVGMVFQHFNLFPHLSVLENLNLAQIDVLNKTKEEASKNSIKYLKQVGLLDKKDSYPTKLSGGEKQRIAIARSLTMDPKTILFDEPTSALDPEMVKEVLLVMKYLAKLGINMIIVTHEMGFAKTIADEIIVMDKGNVIEKGSSDDIFINSKNNRTKSFLEAINIDNL